MPLETLSASQHQPVVCPFSKLEASLDKCKQRILDTPSKLGQTITDRVEEICRKAEMVRSSAKNFAAHTWKTPARVGCSIFSLSGGVMGTLSGHVITGPIMAACAVKELKNLCSAEPTNQLEGLFGDINADVGMIQTLQEANQDSCKTVRSNLDLIGQDVSTLQSQLDHIRRINTQGLEHIKGHKEKAASLNAQSLEAYAEAAELFQAARSKLEKSRDQYGKCGGLFAQLEKIAREDSGLTLQERIEHLMQTARSASETCKSGKELLDASAADLDTALEAFKRASSLKDQATAACYATVQMAEDSLRAGMEKTAYTQDCQKRIEATQREMAKIQKRSDQIMGLIEELKQDVVQAKQEAEAKFGLSEVAVGLGIAAVAVPPLGVTCGVATGVGTVLALHHSSTLSWAASKVYRLATGVSEPKSEPMKPGELISVQFNEISSGYWGRFVQQRPSVTVGTLKVNLGEGSEMTIPFNLNQRDKIAKEDLLTLLNSMNEKVASGLLQPQRCLNILNQLETVCMDRGQWHSKEVGLIKQSSPTYAVVALLKESCEKRIQLK